MTHLPCFPAAVRRQRWALRVIRVSALAVAGAACLAAGFAVAQAPAPAIGASAPPAVSPSITPSFTPTMTATVPRNITTLVTTTLAPIGPAAVMPMASLTSLANTSVNTASNTTATTAAATAAADLPAAPAPSVPTGTDTLVLRGQYLARAGDCISCHTRPQGAPFAGGLAMRTPFGTIVSTNITPDPEQGIGRYTQEDFNRALREGRARDGRYLYPAMPYTNFARLSDGDLQALYAYFSKGVAPARQQNAATALPWPFSMRWLMAGWNLLYLPGRPFESDNSQSIEWNRGAYLVQGLGHCSACHTPRAFTGAEKAATEKGGGVFLSGALIDGWYAQPLRNTAEPGLATWSVQDIVDYLKTGRTARTAAFGPMAQVVANSTQHLSRDDLGAVAVYLKSLNDGGTATVAPVQVDARATATTTALRQGNVSQRGAMVYLNNCSACHRSDGQGAQKTFPTLAGSSTVAAKDATSLIRLVLQGSAMPHTSEAPSALGMPGFGWRLSDQNVADVLSFVRSSWGNRAEPVAERDVAKIRDASTKAAAPGPAPGSS